MKRLTVFESACIVAGNGIGGGLMALPWLVERAGLAAALVVFAAAYIVSVLLHTMVADMLLSAKNGTGILQVFEEFLFRGKWQKLLSFSFFALLAVVLLANLAAYIAGGADILADLAGLSLPAARIAFYIAAAAVPLWGLKSLGVSEKAGVLFMSAVALVLAVLSAFAKQHPIAVLPLNPKAPLALYGLVMFSFSALFSVPQIVQGLGGDAAGIKKSLALGFGVNLAISLTVSVSAAAASEQVTPVAIIGWSAALGTPVRILASLLILFAMLTSFWAISLALADMVRVQLGLSPENKTAFIFATVPCLLLTFFGGAGFISFMGVAGGAVAVIIALLLLPAYARSARSREHPPLLGAAGDKKWFILTIGLCYLLMAAGAVLAV